MANTKSTQHEIDLTSELNLNRFKADIKPYNGFNERNSPYYGGCLSPLYIKDEGTAGDTSQFYNGHEYSTTGGSLKKDGVTVMTVSTQGFEQTVYNKGEEYLNYYDDNHYVIYKDGEVKTYYEGTYYSNPNESTYVNSKIEENDGKIIIVTTSPNYIRATTKLNGTVISYNLYLDSYEIDPNVDSTRISSKLIYSGGRTFWLIFYRGGAFTLGPYYKMSTSTWEEGIVPAWVTDGVSYSSKAATVTVGGVSKDFTGITYQIYSKPNRVWIGFSDSSSTAKNGDIKDYYDTSNVYYTTVAVPQLYRWVSLRNKNTLKIGWTWTTSGGLFTNGSFDCIIGLHSNSLTFTTDTRFTGWIINVGSPTKTKSAGSVEYVLGLAGMLTGQGQGVGTNLSGSPFFRYRYFPDKSTTPTTYPMFVDMNDVAGFVSDADSKIQYYGTTGNWPSLPGGTIKKYGNWRLLLDKDCIPIGFSYGYQEDIGTLVTPWGSIDASRQIHGDEDDGFTYFDVDQKKWVNIDLLTRTNVPFTIIGDYVVLNTTDYYNCYRISDGTRHHWASDWNNRLNVSLGTSDLETFTTYSNSYTLASGQNPNWSDDDPPSATFSAVVVNASSATLSDVRAPCGNEPSGTNLIRIFKDSNYLTTIMSVSTGGLATLSTESGYAGLWPTQVRYNIPIMFDVIDSGFDLTLVKFDETSFAVMYYDNKIRYQYTNNSIASFDNMFVLQAQAYGLVRDKIYALTYSGDTLMSSQVVAPTLGLQFIGATLYNAYFYSKTTRAIYSFSADNNLKVFTQADSITSVTGASYLPATGSILIGTPDCLYVLNEIFGIYRINDIKNFSVASQGNGVVTVKTTGNHKYSLSYEPKTLYTKQNVILDTAFYGVGSNIVSVNDCWYVRVTDQYHGEGEIKLAVSTLTDIGRQTEERTFKIKANDWDELTDTFYIRFQPKLQRAVGVSLHIESPFKVAYIGVGATPETLQLNNKGSI